MAIRIPIEADLGGVKSALAGLTGDADTAKRSVDSLSASAASLKAALASVAKQGVDINPADALGALEKIEGAAKDTLDELKSIDGKKVGAESLSALKRAMQDVAKEAGKLNREMSGGSSGKKSPAAQMLADAKEAEKVLERTKKFFQNQHGLSISNSQASQFNAATGGASPHALSRARQRAAAEASGVNLPGSGGGRSGHPSGQRIGRLAGAVGGAVAGIASGGDGGMFQSMGSGVGAMAGLIPGAGVVLGPLLGAALGGIGAQIDSAMTDALNEALDASKLKHALADVSLGFDDLLRNTRDAAQGLGLTYGESVKLARSYAHEVGSFDKGDMRGALGFARQAGVEGQQGVDFFAKSRKLGLTSDDSSSRRFALLIAEAIGKGGLFSKADEVLSAVSAFSVQAAHISLGTPGAGGFASLLASGTGMNLAGLDAQNAASLINRADSSMRSGGAFGDASRVTLMTALHGQGMNVYDVDTLMQGGLFGSKASAFGKNSSAYKTSSPAEQARLLSLASGSDADTTNLSRTMAQIKSQSPSEAGMAAMVKNTFGFQSNDQARAFIAMNNRDPGLGGLSSRLGGLGINVGGIDQSRMMQLAEINGEDSSRLKTRAGKWGIDASGSTEALRDRLLQAGATRDPEQIKGEEAQQATIDIKNMFSGFAGGRLMDLTTQIKEGITALVIKMAPDSDFAKSLMASSQSYAKLREAGDASHENNASVREQREAFSRKTQADLDITNEMLKTAPAGEGRDRLLKMRAKLEQQQASSSIDNILRNSDFATGSPMGLARAQAMVESRLDPNATNVNRNKDGSIASLDRGLFQINSITQAGLEKETGKKYDPYDPAQSAEMRNLLIQRLLKKNGGNMELALREYQGGSNQSNWGENNASYVPRIKAAAGMGATDSFGAWVPPENAASDRKKAEASVSGAFQHTITLQNERGETIAAPIKTATEFGKPAGVN